MTSAYVLILMASIEGPTYDPGPVRPDDGATPAQIEVSRIRRHLSHVEQTLRANPPGGLTQQQRAARERSLDALHEYWRAGEFPKNRDFHDRRLPYFIDADGTACAVGHLMIESGDAALAREIATYENNDFVEQIEHPGVPGWLDRNGFVPWEAAWIQPTYGPCGFSMPLACGTDGNTYLCEYIAVQCAGVQVAHEGACGSATTTGGSTGTGASTDSGGDPGPVIGEEICPAMETTGGIGTGSATNTAGTTSPPPTTGGAGGSGGDDSSSGTGASEGDDKGCSCHSAGTTPRSLGLAVLALLALRRRRRPGPRLH